MNKNEQLKFSINHIVSTYTSTLLGFVSGFSVFYFLYFLDAYSIQKGFSYSGHSHFVRSICFGLLTFSYLTIFEVWIKPIFKIERLRGLFLWYAFLVVFGSQLIFILFNYFWNWQEWNLEAYGLIVKEFPLLMILPLLLYFALQALLKPKTYEDSYLLFQSSNGKDQLKIICQDFLYAQSAENYITINYLSNKELKQHLIRKPLKRLEEELNAHPEIIRNHRSYLVNRFHVQTMKQTKGKVLIELGGISLPVSKNFQDNFLS